jgi:hypothetical protein
LTDELWLVHDETRWDDGQVDRRDGTARLVGPDRIRFTYDDMPGGTEIHLREDGYDFAPYRMSIALPLLPFPLVVRCLDSNRLEASGEIVDEIDIYLLGVPLGRQTMRLRPLDSN